MEEVVGRVRNSAVQIVKDEYEAGGGGWSPRPLDGGRNLRASLRIAERDHAAIWPRGGDQRHGLEATASPTAAASTSSALLRGGWRCAAPLTGRRVLSEHGGYDDQCERISGKTHALLLATA